MTSSSVHLARLVRLAALCTLIGTPAWAGKYNEKLDIGDRPAAWSELPAATGGSLSLKDYQDKKAVVVTFTCNECPVAKAYQDRMIALADKYKDQPVAFVAINVNKGEDLAQMAKVAEEKGFNFPYVYDASQQSAKNYGAICTPHTFLLNADRSVVYMGAIDDNLVEKEATTHYLQDALDALLAGKPVAQAESRPHGCGIQWR